MSVALIYNAQVCIGESDIDLLPISVDSDIS